MYLVKFIEDDKLFLFYYFYLFNKTNTTNYVICKNQKVKKKI